MKRREIENRYDPRVQSYQKISAEFGLLILRSLLTLNGGALLAFPAYLGALNKLARNENIPDLGVVFPFALFVAGLVCAIAASYGTYWNFRHLTEYNLHSMNKELNDLFDKNEQSKTTASSDKEEERSQYRQKMESEISNSLKSIKTSGVFAICLGWLSATLFVVGCWFAGKVLSI